MKRSLLLLTFIAAFLGCGTTGSPVITKVSHTIDCTIDQVKEQLPAIVDDASTCLVGGNYLACLAQLGIRVGDDAVVCAVAVAKAEAVHRASGRPGMQPNAEAITAHADDYLARRGVTFAQ